MLSEMTTRNLTDALHRAAIVSLVRNPGDHCEIVTSREPAAQLGTHLSSSSAVGVIWPSLLFPDDDLTLAAVLKGPLFALDEETLFDLAYARGKEHLWDRLRNRGETDAALRQMAERLSADHEIRSAFIKARNDFGIGCALPSLMKATRTSALTSTSAPRRTACESRSPTAG